MLFFYNQRIHSRLHGKPMDGYKCKYTLFFVFVKKNEKKIEENPCRCRGRDPVNLVDYSPSPGGL